MDKLRILLFGSTGMLGAYVCSYLKQQNLNVQCIEKIELNNLETSIKNRINTPKSLGASIVINCIGIIPQSKSPCDIDYIQMNSIFPRKLALICCKLNLKLIHITTDCVFNGHIPVNASYTELSQKNEFGAYGISKAMGEDINATIIRTSIIGETCNNRPNHSLLEWLRSNKNKNVSGYTNHYWNGVTCLELAKLIYKLLQNPIRMWIGIRHIYSPYHINKYALLCLINKEYNLNIKITPIQKSNGHINKCLESIYSCPIVNTIDQQLFDLRQFKF